MASFKRKLKRKRTVVAKKQFMKHFKKAMLNFKNQVKCSKCGRRPSEGENIDNWLIDQTSENIDLICNLCTPSHQENVDEN